MTVFISWGLNLSSPLYTTCHFSSAVMSTLPSAKWPPLDLKRTSRHIMWDFYQMALEPQCVEHSFSYSFNSPLWFQLWHWWKGQAIRNSLPSCHSELTVVWNWISTTRHANATSVSLIYERSNRFSESIYSIDSTDVTHNISKAAGQRRILIKLNLFICIDNRYTILET